MDKETISELAEDIVMELNSGFNVYFSGFRDVQNMIEKK